MGQHSRRDATIDRALEAPIEPSRATAGAPNVVIWLMDDVGFGQLEPYGGPVAMPTLRGLAQRGVRFVNGHVTPLCSPTRAALLTGRNHHRAHMGSVSEAGSGFPGYDARVPRSTGTIAEVLRAQGYATYALGKWHLAAPEDLHMGGSRARWPLARGFDRYYGFLGADTNQWEPALIHDNHSIPVPDHTSQGEYHLTDDLVDQSISFVRDLRSADPTKPFLLYMAFGASHSPHHAPRRWIDQYRGRFDDGWDSSRQATFDEQRQQGIVDSAAEISPDEGLVPRWDSMTDAERRVAARLMECFAGMTSHMDEQVGRLLEELERLGDLENTIVIALSDNGATSVGGRFGSMSEDQVFNHLYPADAEELLTEIENAGTEHAYNIYGAGWAWAGDTPFRQWKGSTYRGGCTVPFVVSWPDGVSRRGDIETTFVHAVDVLPTILELTGITPPERLDGIAQDDIDGASFASQLTDAGAEVPSRTQYFEMIGNRAIYSDGWRAVCPWPNTAAPRPEANAIEASAHPSLLPMLTAEVLDALELNGWELYDTRHDPAECRDLALEYPEKLRELVALWWAEAERNQALPLLGRAGIGGFLGDPSDLRHYRYLPGTSPIPLVSMASFVNRDFALSARLRGHTPGDEGVLFALGGRFGGFSLYLHDDRLVFHYSHLGDSASHLVSEFPIPPGSRDLRLEFLTRGEPRFAEGLGAPATASMVIDGRPAGTLDIDRTVPVAFAMDAQLTCGHHPREAFDDLYAAPFAFTGTLEHVDAEFLSDPYRNVVLERQAALAHQ